MSPERPGSRSGATAGYTLVATIVLCAAIAGGVGALLGSVGPFVIGGVFVGAVAGVALVIARYRRL